MSPPHIQSQAFFGLRTDILGNAHFITDSEIIYPAGGVLVLHEYDKNSQRYIYLTEDKKSIQSIIIAPNKKFIALSEKVDQKSQKPTISVYNLQTLKREKILTIPFEGITCTEFATMQFTCDSKYIVAITGEPDWMLYYYNWENGKIESQAKAQNPNGQGIVTQVNCNPTDASLIVISGPSTFRLMNVSETVWRQWGWAKAENITITTCMWLTADRVMFGTKTGALMTVENGELKENCSYRGGDVTTIEMKKIEEKDAASLAKDLSIESSIRSYEANEIRCLSIFSKGFAYSCGNGLVHMFEKESKHKWLKRNVFRVTDELFRIDENEYVDLNIIQHISINPSQNTLLVTTLKSQLYFVKLFEQHMHQESEIPFKELGQMLHHGKINGLAICSWKPIFMTSGEDDRSIRLWNYETKEIELIKFYHGDIYSISLHPTGLFALIAFSDKLRYVVVLIDDFQPMREFSIRNCRVCRFSNNGHMFAAVNGSIIQVFSTISFDNVFNLKGHNATIRAISWAGRDDKLVSCGSDGAIYEWCLTTGNRLSEVIMKNNDFTGCSVNSDGKSAYIVGIDGEVKEVQNNVIVRNLKIIGIKLDNIVLARSDFMLFVTGGAGNVVSIQFPLLDKAVFAEFHMHNRNVTALGLSYDDQTLVTVAEDATICIWKLINAEGKAIEMPAEFAYSKEILINKNELKEKNKNIEDLSYQIREMETVQAYQIRQTNITNSNKLKEIHIHYNTAIEEMKSKIEYMETEHNHEVNNLKSKISNMESDHETIIKNMDAEFNEQRIEEYNKYQALESANELMKNDYEDRLEKLKKGNLLALQEMKDDYETQLMKQNDKITELNVKNKLEASQHEYIKTLIEDDADREIVEIKTDYEGRLKEEKDVNVRLKGEADLLKTKIIAAQKNLKDHTFQILQLQSELQQYQTAVQSLGKDITDLKKEICGRDVIIQGKEKQIHSLKSKNEEFEKHTFVLNYKIEELQKQIHPKEILIDDLQVQLKEKEINENKLLSANKNAEYEKNTMKEKLHGLQEEVKKISEKNYYLNHTYKKIQDELYSLSEIIQNPIKLKTAVKDLLRFKQKTDENTQHEKEIESDIVREFNKQKNSLEQQIATVTKKLKTVTSNSRASNIKVLKENMKLLEEVSKLRKELEEKRKQYTEMKALLGLSPAHVTPSRAREMIYKAAVNFDEFKMEYENKLEEKELIIDNLKAEINKFNNIDNEVLT